MSSSSLQLPLSHLTRPGLTQFRKLIGVAPSISISELEKRILEIAGGANSAEVVDEDTMVTVFPSLDSRLHTAKTVTDILDQAGIEAGPASGHDLLFSWLALVFLPSLCRRSKSGTADTGRMYRYVLSRSSSDFYRHLVACPYWLHRRYGASARIFLAQDAFVMPDVVEQIASRPSLIDSPGVVELLDRLYWDKNANSPVEGFTTSTRLENPPPGYAKASPNSGTLRALEWTLGQLQCTYDLRSMSADQIMDKLPKEFGEWAKQHA